MISDTRGGERGQPPMTAELKLSARASTFSFVLAGALLLLTQLGYSFERGDQLQYLLLPYRMIEPAFLPGDWFTWHTTHYHHAFAFAVVGLHTIAGPDGFPVAMLVAHFGVLLALCYALLRLCRAWGFSSGHAGAAIAIVALVRESGVGGQVFNHAQLLPSDMALPPFLLACAFFLERRSLAAGLWLGLSGLLHANFAVLGPAVLLPAQAWSCLRERRWLPLFGMSALFGLLAAPVLVLIARDFVATDIEPSAVSHMLAVRAPHHFELGAFSPQAFWWLGLLWICGMPAWLSARWAPARERPRALLAMLLAMLAFALAGGLLEVHAVMRLYIWRLSIPLIAVLLMVWAQSVVEFARVRNVAGLLWSLGCLIAASAFARDDLREVSAGPLPEAWFALPAALPLLLGGAALCRRSKPWPSWALALCISLPVLWSVRALCQPPPHAAEDERPLRGPRLGSFRLRPKPREIFDRVRATTPPNARFLIPPSLIGFRLQARRAAYVDWKCVPMKGVEAAEWERRMLAVLGTRSFPELGYDLRLSSGDFYFARPLSELAALARKERLSFLVADRHAAWSADTGLEPYFSSGKLRVYRVMSRREMRRAHRIGLNLQQ